MAQNRLVNYRHLLSKCGVCCQVLQHEVGLVRRGEKVEPGVELHGRMLCHVLLDCLSSPCPSSESGSAVGILAHTLRGNEVPPSQYTCTQKLCRDNPLISHSSYMVF